jgi:dienelactone hydrolase
MKQKFQQLRRWLTGIIKKITPGENAIRGASLGLLFVTAFFWILFAFGTFKNIRDGWVLLFFLLFATAAILFGFLARWGIGLLGKLPGFLKLALLISVPLLFIAMSFDWITAGLFTLFSLLCGAAFLVLKQTGFQNLPIPKKVVLILGMLLGLGGFLTAGILYFQDGFDVGNITNAARTAGTNIEQIRASSPAAKGMYEVKTLTYGRGEDQHRPEFGDEADLKTDSVNGLALIDNWEGFGGWWREHYWGFDSRSLPLNARVWYPQGDGPFPLALIVHGNHSMQDYSDPGYGYLGELLASRGIILASVDENFINGSWSDIFGSLEEENDARGWLLLEHLKLWHQWNRTEDHFFQGKIDTSNLALIGHSRGGEAVAHAAMFNTLPYYPDDASVKFDYNFDIKSIVAIAPVDGQYKPGESRSKFENVSYLVLHGAQDADVSSFMGSQQYERIRFTDSLYHFKAGVYAYGANHGQFNTSWGNNDTGNPFTGLLNLKQLLPAEDQERIALVYISAFLDITLKDKKEYLPLLVDARRGRDWLPETIYLNQFEDSSFEPVASFDEDFNVVSTTQEGGEISSKNLTVWREQEIELKWEKKGSRALFAGWNYDLKNKSDSVASLPDSVLARYEIRLPHIAIDSTAALVFSMAESGESADPKSKGKWVKNEAKNTEENTDTEDDDDEKEEEENEDEEEIKKPIDFTVQLIDSTGQKVSFPLSRFAPLQREIEVVIKKADFLTDEKESEKVFQTFYFPVADLRSINPDFDISGLRAVKFIFDRSKSGVVVIDNVGFMKSL